MKMKPIAVAVAAALPVASMAATLVGPAATANKVSAEFVTLNKFVSGLGPQVDLGAAYTGGDIITVEFNQAPKVSSGTGAAATRAYSWPLALDIVDSTGADIGDLSLIGSTDTSVSYRVATITQNLATPELGEVILPTDMRFFPTADVTFSARSETSTGTAIDAATTAAGASSATLYDLVGSQFAATVGGLSQTVNVEAARKAFDKASATTTHQITVAVAYDVGSPAAAYAVEADDVTLVLDGDFSWVDSNTATTATGVQGGAGSVELDGATTGVAVGVDGTRITITGIASTVDGIAAASGGNGGVIELTNTTSQVIPLQTITATVTGNYTDANVATGGGTATTNVTSSATASGSYVLNGSTVTVFAVPTSAAASNFIWLSNTGTTTGDVEITVYDNGTEYELGVVGSSAGGTEFDVTAALNAALEAQGITLSGGRVHMDIVTKAPGRDIAVSAAYRVGDDRVNLVTSLEAPRT